MNEPTRKDIQIRLNDWYQRIDALFSNVSTWVNSSNKHIRTVIYNAPIKHEEMAKKYDIPSTDVHNLDLYKKDNLLLTFKPMGLWVIGANGRIDILGRNRSYILVDQAAPLSAAKWVIHSSSDRINGRDFIEPVFSSILEENNE